MSTNLACFPVQPIFPPPPPEAYYGLLTDPVGQYGRAPLGASIAYTLRGSEAFISKAHTLFDSFGGETINGPLTGGGKRWRETRPVVLHRTPDPLCSYFCLPPHRVLTALRTYLFCHLYKHKAVVTRLMDEEDPDLCLDTVCHNEDELEHEAAVLAETFYLNEIRLDYGGLPEYGRPDRFHIEHGVMESEGEDELDIQMPSQLEWADR